LYWHSDDCQKFWTEVWEDSRNSQDVEHPSDAEMKHREEAYMKYRKDVVLRKSRIHLQKEYKCPRCETTGCLMWDSNCKDGQKDPTAREIAFYHRHDAIWLSTVVEREHLKKLQSEPYDSVLLQLQAPGPPDSAPPSGIVGSNTGVEGTKTWWRGGG